MLLNGAPFFNTGLLHYLLDYIQCIGHLNLSKFVYIFKSVEQPTHWLRNANRYLMTMMMVRGRVTTICWTWWALSVPDSSSGTAQSQQSGYNVPPATSNLTYRMGTCHAMNLAHLYTSIYKHSTCCDSCICSLPEDTFQMVLVYSTCRSTIWEQDEYF